MSKRRQGLDTEQCTTVAQSGGDMHLGWDWASQRHDVTVIDDRGQLVDRWALAHNEAGLHQAMTRLAGHGRPEHLPVAIEATSGIVVDRLLATGHPVVPTRPNSFNAARPRWGASKATSDPGDSFKLAEDLCTDGHRLRRLQPTDAATLNLQAISRLRADHLEAKTTATMKLSALLAAHWPGAKAIFARLDSDIALDFLERYPTKPGAQQSSNRPRAVHRRHGGRRARMRGRLRVAQDWRLLAAAVNLARFAALGIAYRPGGWTMAAT